ncbi:MAG TPA: gluconate 2-dehydrogenase subunit 3 family protein [Candidatus Binatia bacterium]|nr:gluconate 2-dehydrogenase subunit 3 family protein [Candidatus Binatia bacterium]
MADFTSDDERMLTTLLETILPPSTDGRLPGAGNAALVRHVASTIERMPMLRTVVEYGLSGIGERARQRNPVGWDALSAAERTAVVREFTAENEFFLPGFLFLVYTGYYVDPVVVRQFGFEPRPPHPAGYAMEAEELDALLAPVRRRGKMYREV